MEETELKPCPFCGGKATLIKSKTIFTFADSFCVSCDEDNDCYVRTRTPFRLSKDEAISIWNRRGATDGKED